ncbi:NAD(P)H-dependent flavin oxidoreductase [Candidatus Contubernalis alkaliaceticus]|uniref:NAD(P)H-dependent flavin oxidoreductase n=1 Tax=Candidatus Contubernalis alkaliaceticus TaxID=338645 RepID=UPI001F4C3990|nr:nitronate monooxygenase [Candidatus Contubernalis alkalaceticus]UNC92562.1 nitronate monooxygenase [Candidatus Contubernalis alkalaceticus]
MKLAPLRLGEKIVKLPIFQGGMAVRVSLAPLAAAVANCGGVGTIAGSGMQPGELAVEIKKARSLTSGILGVNVLFAVSNFAELVRAAIHEKIDFIVSGAGFSRDMFSWGKEADVPIIPIVSSAKLAKISEKMGAAAVVVEGKEAGGHLGTDRPLKEILQEVRSVVKIPVVAAGGIVDAKGIAEVLKLGADGVQMATRFVLSKECTVHNNFKNHYLQANKEDVVLVKSPVGFPGRAIRNPLTEQLLKEEVEIDSCDGCLKVCSQEFCIMDALGRAEKGDTKKGLIFSGENVFKIKEILSVPEIFNQLISGLNKIK